VHLFDAVEEVTARDQLHDHIIVARIFHELEDSSDMRMVGLLEDLEFIFIQLLIHLGNLKALLADDLDRAWHFSLFVLSELNLAECASAERPHKLVMLSKIFNLFERLVGLEAKEVFSLLLFLLLGETALLDNRFIDVGLGGGLIFPLLRVRFGAQVWLFLRAK